MGPTALICLSLLLPSCDDTPAPADTEGIARREAGWLRGDLHLHTKWSDGWDDTATVIALAESLESPAFVGFHPEYARNGLDFIAITDHRTVDVLADPEFSSERLILLGGEEFGSKGHAGCLGITELVDHDPDGDGVSLEDVRAAVDHAHAQGGVFSINHPFLPGNPFFWDLRTHDAIEVWNSGWALMSPTFGPEDASALEAEGWPLSVFFRRAIEDQGRGASMQALTYYEAYLARGIQVAVVGGSDRHTALMPGFPTTWVRADGADETSVVEGIRRRRTFVSRTPASTQVLLDVVQGTNVWEMGDEIPLPATSAEVSITFRVGRGQGGLARLIGGGAVGSDAELEGAPLGEVLWEGMVTSDDFRTTLTLQVSPGDWFYPLVLDPLVRPGLSEEEAERVREVARAAMATGDEDFAGLADFALAYTEPDDLLWDASLCDPETWEPDLLQCLPADSDGMATLFVPDLLDRALNVVVENEAITDWCLGAVGSAVRFVAEEAP